jgi:hypothetical protein
MNEITEIRPFLIYPFNIQHLCEKLPNLAIFRQGSDKDIFF